MGSKPEKEKKPFLNREVSKGTVWKALLYSVAIIVISQLIIHRFLPSAEEVTYNKVVELLESNEVKKVTLDDSGRKIYLEDADGNGYYSGYLAYNFSADLLQKVEDAKVPEISLKPYSPPNMFMNLMISLLPMILLTALLFFVLARSGMFKPGSKNKVGTSTNVKFSDVAGIPEIVDELKEAVEVLKNPEKFAEVGARAPRGFLLEGPPGTGKTLIAKAVAGESEATFFQTTGSDFVEIFAGNGPRKVRSLFKEARLAEQAIIFIDEIDAVGQSRSGNPSDGGMGERESTLTELLKSLDGFESRDNIIIIAATNHASSLDPALVRPGRFDRKISVPLPSRKGRVEIFKVHARGKNISDEVDFDVYAGRLPGASGAEIAGIVNEAALEAARVGAKEITPGHFESALQTTIMGRERVSLVMSQADKEITAWHEAGHTVAAMVLEKAADPVSVSIVPRGPAGGVTWMLGADEHYQTRSAALDQLKVCMAGNVAERILLRGDYTQGISGDLQQATNLAMKMIMHSGMGDNLIYINEQNASQETIHAVNDQVSQLLEEAKNDAEGILNIHRNLLVEVAEMLLEQENISAKQLKALGEKYQLPKYV